MTYDQGGEPVAVLEVGSIGVAPVTPAKVSKGLQTWVGYGAAALSAGVAAFVEAAGGDLSDTMRIALLALSGVLVAITNRNRSDQARELTRADATVRAAVAPALPVLSMPEPRRDPNVELSDSMPSELHPPAEVEPE